MSVEWSAERMAELRRREDVLSACRSVFAGVQAAHQHVGNYYNLRGNENRSTVSDLTMEIIQAEYDSMKLKHDVAEAALKQMYA